VYALVGNACQLKAMGDDLKSQQGCMSNAACFAFIEEMRRQPGELQRRLNSFLAKTRQNKAVSQ
jgi:hypothetical protein